MEKGLKSHHGKSFYFQVDSSAKNEKLKSVVDDIDVSTIVLPTKEVPKELTPPCNR